MKAYFLRFRVFLIAVALGLATVQYFDFINNRASDAELMHATIIRPVLAPRFRQTMVFTLEDRTHSYEYVTNSGEKLTEWQCKNPRIHFKSSGRALNQFTIYENKDREGLAYMIYDAEYGRCVDAPTIELGLEFHGRLREESE